MSLFDGINVAEQAMNVHRLRSEIAGENIAGAYTGGPYTQVKLEGNHFSAALARARRGDAPGLGIAGRDTTEGAVRVTGQHVITGLDERTQALMGTVEMLQSKDAFELNMRAATMLKSMALASLEIGRGQ